jgi:hypothetical protein
LKSAPELLRDADLALAALERWNQIAYKQVLPVACGSANELKTLLDQTRNLIPSLQKFLGTNDLLRRPLEQLLSLAQELAADEITPYRLPRLFQITGRLAELGAGPVAAEIARTKPATVKWPRIFEYSWLASCLDKVRAEDPTLATFDGRQHDSFAEEFRALDEERIRLAVARVLRDLILK